MGAPNDSTGSGCRGVTLERVTGANPGVVAAVEKTDVLDAAVAKDERGAARGDLSGAATGPLLVGVSFGVAPVQDDGRVVGDSEASQRILELLRRAAVPVDRALELVRIEVERPREVVLRVLVRHSEVDVEEQEAVRRRGLRATAGENLLEPRGVHESLVVRQPLDRQIRVARPCGPALVVHANAGMAELGQPALEGRDARGVAVQHDPSSGNDALRNQEPLDLERVDALEPLARERDGAGNVPPSGLAVQAPAVVRGKRSAVDDRELGIAEEAAQLARPR